MSYLEEPQGRPLREAERKRRLDMVSDLMRRLGLACIVTAPNADGDGRLQPDSQYLAACGAVPTACIVPADGPGVALDVQRVCADGWPDPSAPQHETIDRLMREIAARVRAAIPTRGRCGITGIGGTAGAPDGSAPYGFVRTLATALPGVEWVDVSEELRAIREIKSDDERALVAKAVANLDCAIYRAANVATPGSSELAVWSAMMGELVATGSDPSVTCRWGSGLRPRILDRPTHGELQRGSLILIDLEASVSGYRTRAGGAIALEGCDALYRDLYQMVGIYWSACVSGLAKAGTWARLDAEQATILERIARDAGLPAKLRGSLTVEGCGLGLDAPRHPASPAGEPPSGPIGAGSVFALTASLTVDVRGREHSASWTDTVALDADGPRRLGTRAPGLLVASGPGSQ